MVTVARLPLPVNYSYCDRGVIRLVSHPPPLMLVYVSEIIALIKPAYFQLSDGYATTQILSTTLGNYLTPTLR